MIEKLPFWNALVDREKAAVKRNTTIRTFEKGAFLRGRNESCLGMIYVLSGSIRTLIISEEGREITLFRLYQGDSCILSASCVLSQITFETQITAAEKTDVLIVNAGIYERLMKENLHVRCFTYELAAERFSSVVWVLQQIIFVGFDKRLAKFLIDYSAKTGKKEIRMTQEEIAREVNSAREVVARMLKQFSLDDLIELRRGSIVIKNRSGLENL